jgi:hypothetical protein
MRNLRNTFKSYEDPKVFFYLKIGFACLIVLGVLIAFAVSPKLRHDVGIGNAHPVSTPKVHHHRRHRHSQEETVGQRQHKDEAHAHQHHAKSDAHPTAHHPIDHPGSAPGEGFPVSHHQPPSSGGGSGKPAPTPEPSSPPTSHPTEHKSEAVEDHGTKVEVEVPGVKIPPVAKAVDTVNEAGKAVTKDVPVPVGPPEVCLLNC